MKIVDLRKVIISIFVPRITINYVSPDKSVEYRYGSVDNNGEFKIRGIKSWAKIGEGSNGGLLGKYLKMDVKGIR